MSKDRQIRVIGKLRPEPDLKKLARAVIELAKQLAAEDERRQVERPKPPRGSP